MSRRLAVSLALALVVHGVLLWWLSPPKHAAESAPPAILAVLVQAEKFATRPEPPVSPRLGAQASVSNSVVNSPTVKNLATTAAPVGSKVPAELQHSVPSVTSLSSSTSAGDSPSTSATPADLPSSSSTSAAAPASIPRHQPASVVASSCRKPDYPPAALRAGEQGVVLLRIHVAEDGRAIDSDIERSSGFTRLDEAARRALVLCQFTPASENGRPVASWARIEYRWQID